jgi:hypothetical protein
MFLNHFDELIFKKYLKKNIYYFNTFLNKKHFKNNQITQPKTFYF